MALAPIQGISTLGMTANQAPSLWSGLQGFGEGLWGGISDVGQGIKNSGLTDLANSGLNFWQAGQQNKMNKDLMNQRRAELGMQQQAFQSDQEYRDALKGIDWTATE